MATTERDYYEVLGVQRDASDAEDQAGFAARTRAARRLVRPTPRSAARIAVPAEVPRTPSGASCTTVRPRGPRGGFDPVTSTGGTSPTSSGVLRRRPSPSRVGHRGQHGADIAVEVEIESTLRTGSSGRRRSGGDSASLRRRRRGAGTEPIVQRDVRRAGRSSRPRAASSEIRTRPGVPSASGTRAQVEHPCAECPAREASRSAPSRSRSGGNPRRQRIKFRRGPRGRLGGGTGDVYVAVHARDRPSSALANIAPDRLADDDPGGARRHGEGRRSTATSAEPARTSRARCRR
jgi:hypothetical protein